MSHIDFEIKGKEKVGVVGKNGAGKTTLLRLIHGEIELDRDDKRQGKGIVMSQKMSIGMLRQFLYEEQEKTVEELIGDVARELLGQSMQEEAYSPEMAAFMAEFDRIFTGFGFSMEDKKRMLSCFSGGEQKRICLTRLFLQKPDILLLDEPDNHLDLKAIEWLEECLIHYPGQAVIVSHDRFFLDKTVNVIYDLMNGRLYRYPGNYSHFREEKARRILAKKKAWERQQEEVRRLEALVERFKGRPRKAAFARSRRSILERMEKAEKPWEEEAHMFTGDMEPAVPGNKWVMELEDTLVGYTSPLYTLSLRVRRGQKIAIIGENGVGKTALLKTLAGEIPPLGGKLLFGDKNVCGYFSQQGEGKKDPDNAGQAEEKAPGSLSVLDHFRALFPALNEKEARKALNDYLFRGTDAHKRVDSLSGGERSRLYLAEMLFARPNLLLLDEPTSHMDIPAKETLESAFRSYTGTILFVSHDRYFIRQVSDAVLLIRDKKAFYYPFGYLHYLNHVKNHPENESPALVEAKNEAFLESFRAVPKKERMQSHQPTTEEASGEWRLERMAEDMEEAEETFAFWHEKKKEAEMLSWLSSGKEDTLPLEKKENRAIEAWTKACIDWLEAYDEARHRDSWED